MTRTSANPPRPPALGRPRAAARGGRWPRRWGLFLLVWTLIGILFAGSTVLRSAAQDRPVPWREVSSDLLGGYLWALLFPVIWMAARRFPLSRDRWLSRLAIHVALGVVFAAVYIVLAVTADAAVGALFGGTGGVLPDAGRLVRTLSAGIEVYLLIYLACLALIQLASVREQLRDGELMASRLQGQVALAQLQVLKMQLHPHFLFNTLNAISALMHRDVDAADRMIAQLSDLLRVSLDKDDRHEVPLRNELDFLQRYLTIEKIRFRDRLKVEMDIEPECLEAFVPKLILQPLVENAIRHGIAMRSAAGRVAVRARRKGSRVEIDVSDDGPGLAQGQPVREGVGLANTRARLEQLYGEDHCVDLRTAVLGGLEVHLEMPFQEEARFVEN